jgi:hypothetical protein
LMHEVSFLLFLLIFTKMIIREYIFYHLQDISY